MHIKLLTEEQSTKWDEYVSIHPSSSAYHLSGWRKVIEETFGYKTYYLLAEDKGEIVGILPMVYFNSLIFGKRFISMIFFNYGGICSNSTEYQEQLLSYAIKLAQEEKALCLELRHEMDNGVNLPVGTLKVSMRLQIPKDSKELWKSLHSKVRSQIRKPIKEGLIVRFGVADEVDSFYKVFSVNMRDLGTPVYGKQFFLNILNQFGKKVTICTVYDNHEPVASGFLVGFKDRLEIPWASSLRNYNSKSPNMLLYWEALKHASEKGYKTFDFGRSSVHSSTYRFKEQWGAKPVQLYWHYWMAEGKISSQKERTGMKFRLASNLWKRMPIGLSRLLGPTIVKHIPFA